MSKTASTIAEYEQALHTMLDENEALRTELAEMKEQFATLVAWVNGDKDTLTVLQLIAHDARLPPETRIKAAGLAVGYERPRLQATATVVVDFYDRVKRARLAANAKLLAEPKVKTIEHEPPALPEPA